MTPKGERRAAAAAAAETPERLTLGKWQEAHRAHACSACVEAIEPGENYLRAARVEGPHLEALARLQGSSVVWHYIAREKVPVEKFHEACFARLVLTGGLGKIKLK